jgi:hypothetical protein
MSAVAPEEVVERLHGVMGRRRGVESAACDGPSGLRGVGQQGAMMCPCWLWATGLLHGSHHRG